MIEMLQEGAWQALHSEWGQQAIVWAGLSVGALTTLCALCATALAVYKITRGAVRGLVYLCTSERDPIAQLIQTELEGEVSLCQSDCCGIGIETANLRVWPQKQLIELSDGKGHCEIQTALSSKDRARIFKLARQTKARLDRKALEQKATRARQEQVIQRELILERLEVPHELAVTPVQGVGRLRSDVPLTMTPAKQNGR